LGNKAFITPKGGCREVFSEDAGKSKGMQEEGVKKKYCHLKNIFKIKSYKFFGRM
jgi:hypothetical protein